RFPGGATKRGIDGREPNAFVLLDPAFRLPGEVKARTHGVPVESRPVFDLALASLNGCEFWGRPERLDHPSQPVLVARHGVLVHEDEEVALAEAGAEVAR